MIRVPVELANRVKIKVLGGSHLILCGLFFVILLNNLVGVVPESAKRRAQLFFGLGFALPLWLGFIMSRVFIGCVYISLARMVLKGLPVLGGALLWFVEWRRIIIRWITLRVRLRANISVGVVMVRLLNGVLMVLLFGPRP